MTVEKSLDTKLATLLRDASCGAFILADAKDADMALGMAAPGRDGREGGYRTLQAYRETMRRNVEQGLLDIMLMSASSNEVLTFEDGIFENSPVTPAIRANDSTDIWWSRGSAYASQPSRPFRSASLDHALSGTSGDAHRGADLGLYSITLNNDTELDLVTIEAYAAFRAEAEAKGFRHFLEVFDPNAPRVPIKYVARFINDSIARILAGVVEKSRPIFLKIVYHGPAAMEELVSYDSRLVVGILGGASGTTYDAFHQLWEARKYGARVALYGRMINDSEDQPAFIQHLRWLADGDITDPAEAVRSYHGALGKLEIQPYRELAADLERTLSFEQEDI